jgi:hypothetical protein
MARARKGYTDKQNIVAEWINLGHTEMRTETQARCYATTGQTSHWYEFVKPYGQWLGQGTYHLEGSGKVGNDYRGIGGRLVNYTARSSHCGIKIQVHGATLHGKSILFLILNK